METVLLLIPLLPLFGSAVAGFLRHQVGRSGAHWITIMAVAGSALLSAWVAWQVFFNGLPTLDYTVYTWAVTDGITFEVGFLVDSLTALMMTVVTFVSLMVHIYTIGYMHDDPGYQRFFAYINLFTFAMLMLVMANNFMQLFFGWEAVGLVSYLLIGFWFKKDTAVKANLKAFLVNRVGDFGFLLGIAAILVYMGSLNYAEVFDAVPAVEGTTISLFGDAQWSLMTVICICLFIGAMGKSAQVPLHVWLPDSMEGPTPISALIHAATMVTAGIFMVARLSPIFETSDVALSFILVIGAITALFMGLVGIVQNDIKRVVAYSTLSQLGYMTVALGASAYSVAIFHLMTHAFFKALLFLGAGSVIIALHHKQDMREMGGLAKYMPITAATAWVGSLALIGFPFFSGFFSKDLIIEAVHYADRPGAGFAYFAVMAGVVITALYTFRMLYLTFHGSTRMDEETRSHAHESPAVVTIPLILLAIPSLAIGYFTVEPLLFGGALSDSIFVREANDVVANELAHKFDHGALAFALHGFVTPVFWLAMLGVGISTYIYLFNPGLAETLKRRLHLAWTVLDRKYGFDELWQKVLAGTGLSIASGLSKGGDRTVIDGWLVNGSARLVGRMSGALRQLQSGFLFHYAFVMVVALVALVASFVLLR
ncbi:NADH-quinone oxidoreductase subunit L [Wenzhouxiangella sediminis]|uniref:NADH-quinone oxidoreductase subunit L n=1 Tax=Wenzhouxiangella sediminis TaxID=1792836 RepID=A0A3E1KCW0_9GAMM|nr:NADH-quinone oxidoreductase subunit L [Wenzhouxiangella sediminis]RFF32626.1 NADH-quinone oxidoreductase subunit L [Wenzhouxiangella sediminis]